MALPIASVNIIRRVHWAMWSGWRAPGRDRGAQTARAAPAWLAGVARARGRRLSPLWWAKKSRARRHGSSLGRKRPRKQASEPSKDCSFAALHKIVMSPLRCKIKIGEAPLIRQFT